MAGAMPQDDSLKHMMLGEDKSFQVPDKNFRASVHQLYLKDISRSKEFREFEIGDAPAGIKGREKKILLLVGATGAGKTTLINSWVNYIFGVDVHDTFRFKLVTEEASISQVHSQTQHICVYTLYHQDDFMIPFTMIIIDTPGFGDTRGITRDKQIFGQIYNLFNSELRIVDHIDAVGFVAKSSDARLSKSQKYIFDSILQMFGKDIEENILLLLTHGDNGRPEVLPAIKAAKIPYKKSFKFNSSGVFGGSGSNNGSDEDDEENRDFTENFWNLGQRNFGKFIQALDCMTTKSTVLTQGVLYERTRLEAYSVVLYNQVQAGLLQLRELKHDLLALKGYEEDMENNRKYTYEVDEDVATPVRLQDGKSTTVWRGLATILQSFGIDMVVPPTHKTVIKKVKKTKTYEDIKARYEAAEDNHLSLQDVIVAVYAEFEGIEQEIMGVMCEIRDAMNRLNQIALKPDNKSMVDYIDDMILLTKASRGPHWKEQVEDLERYRECSVQLMKIASDDFDPFREFTCTKEESKVAAVETLVKRVKDLWLDNKPYTTLDVILQNIANEHIANERNDT